MSLRSGGANAVVRRALEPGEQVVAVVRLQRRTPRATSRLIAGTSLALVAIGVWGTTAQPELWGLPILLGLLPLIVQGLLGRRCDHTGALADGFSGSGVVAVTDRRLLAFSMRRQGHAARLRASAANGTFRVGRITTGFSWIDAVLIFADGSTSDARAFEQAATLIPVVDHLRRVSGAFGPS